MKFVYMLTQGVWGCRTAKSVGEQVVQVTHKNLAFM